MVTSAQAKPVRIQALARASVIIDVVATGEESGVGLTVISKATSLNKTTAFNLLASLVALGFVEQDTQTRKYRLGLRCLELGRQVQQRLQVSHLARPVLVELCRKTNETVNLGQLRGFPGVPRSGQQRLAVDVSLHGAWQGLSGGVGCPDAAVDLRLLRIDGFDTEYDHRSGLPGSATGALSATGIRDGP